LELELASLVDRFRVREAVKRKFNSGNRAIVSILDLSRFGISLRF